MFGRLQYRPGTMDKQGPQIGITSLAYPEQDLFTPTGVLTWNQSEPGSQLSAILEIVGFTNGRNQRAGGNRANTRDLADTLAESILPIALLNLLVESGTPCGAVVDSAVYETGRVTGYPHLPRAQVIVAVAAGYLGGRQCQIRPITP